MFDLYLEVFKTSKEHRSKLIGPLDVSKSFSLGVFCPPGSGHLVFISNSDTPFPGMRRLQLQLWSDLIFTYPT